MDLGRKNILRFFRKRLDPFSSRNLVHFLKILLEFSCMLKVSSEYVHLCKISDNCAVTSSDFYSNGKGN